MRDIDMMAATMHRIHDSGAGCAHRLQTCAHALAWLAGGAALNGQAVSKLIADGWLSNPTRIDHAQIVAWPLTQEGSSYA